MPGTNAQTTGVTVEERTASPGRSDGDRPRDHSRAVARGACADPARHRSGRRRFVDPTACEADYAAAVEEFQQAMEKYKQRSGRMFPTWSEVLEVLQGLGYEKVAGQPAAPGAPFKDGGGRG
jgi:hypothetical protein